MIARAARYALLAAALLASGCMNKLGGTNDEPVQTFLLDVSQPTAITAPAGAPVVIVAAPQVRAGYDSPRLAYTQRDFELRYYARSEWADAPAAMLRPLVVRALAATGRLTPVVTAVNSTAPQWQLGLEILELRHAYAAQGSEGRIVIRAELARVDQPGAVHISEFSAARAAATQDPYGGVGALNAALGAILPQLAAFVAAGVTPPGP
jgi:cholesterol transport system auxiliary component